MMLLPLSTALGPLGWKSAAEEKEGQWELGLLGEDQCVGFQILNIDGCLYKVERGALQFRGVSKERGGELVADARVGGVEEIFKLGQMGVLVRVVFEFSATKKGKTCFDDQEVGTNTIYESVSMGPSTARTIGKQRTE